LLAEDGLRFLNDPPGEELPPPAAPFREELEAVRQNEVPWPPAWARSTPLLEPEKEIPLRVVEGWWGEAAAARQLLPSTRFSSTSSSESKSSAKTLRSVTLTQPEFELGLGPEPEPEEAAAAAQSRLPPDPATNVLVLPTLDRLPGDPAEQTKF
jgi:hypothetical protein